MRVEAICRKIIKKVTPTQLEKDNIYKIANCIKDKVKSKADEFVSNIQVTIGGSVAKDTWLKNEADIDVFMLFPVTTDKKNLEKIGLKIAEDAMKNYRRSKRYADHPYLESCVNDVRINIVPCFKVDQMKWLSAADRTPFHTKYIKKKLLKKDLRNDIRLLKAFMRGIGVYGAEIKIGGFSGYLCELIVLSYQSFMQSLKMASEWKLQEVIDIENLHKGRLNEVKRFFNAPLIVVDPVDANRNVAAAVSEQSLGEFIMASKYFLENPQLSFFQEQESIPISIPLFKKKLKKLNFDLVSIVFEGDESIPDILWGQLYKSMKAIRKTLIQNDFNVLKGSSWSDERKNNVMIFALETSILPPSKRRIGPHFDSKDAIDFLAKHVGKDMTIGPWIENKRWVIGVKRKYTDAVSLLREKLKNGGNDIGIARRLIEKIRSSHKILVNEEIIDLYSSNEQLKTFLIKFLDKKLKWMP
ncbi:MAG: CCA tRNA nucleotidyltransferase [Candidatus Bathyarchaeota archaeon]|nr:MAG: CCA tRNA nucleotidyltransferase [Candidatus Bathyarchaeota archaeon]